MKVAIYSMLVSVFFLCFSRSFSAELIKASSENKSNVYQFANQCYLINLSHNNSYLAKKGSGYVFSEEKEFAMPFYMRPTALGVYLLFDQEEQYLIAEGQHLHFATSLESEMTLDIPEEDYLITPAEWKLQTVENIKGLYLKNIKENTWLTEGGLNKSPDFAAAINFEPASGCADFPESELGAVGVVTKTLHDNGMLWGFADAHEHSGANHGFGGKIFHGASFHKLGIEHALADCEKHHGENGSKDLMSVTYKSGSGSAAPDSFGGDLYDHLIKGKADHLTDGYPTLIEWNAHQAPTHQGLYYKWIERAYLGGMRVMVEYMESTEVVCEVYKTLLPGNSEAQSCNEMKHVDHQLIKIRELQDYVDAQSGGPGKGWFRIVYSPEQAREVVKAGKLAVILGIEIENPFDCFVDQRDGFEVCDDELVRERLNSYYNKGVRALFPSHKFVNAFSSGDGNAGVLEIGDYLNTGQWRDYVPCKEVPGKYWMKAHGEGEQTSIFSKLARVPGIDMFNKIFSDSKDLTKQVLPIYPEAAAHCQRTGFTRLGMSLIEEMMSLGMIIDLGHTPRASLNDIIPVLVDYNYPAVHTHGGDQAAVNLINGLSSKGLGSACRDEEGNSGLLASFKNINEQVDPETGLPRKGLSYDFNGFASYNKPRFGELSHCEHQQESPLTYPFRSFAGDIIFEKLQTGEQVFDFNQFGLANIGLYPDLIEEARRGGASQESINALFKTAEAYIRLWERAERSAAQHRKAASG